MSETAQIFGLVLIMLLMLWAIACEPEKDYKQRVLLTFAILVGMVIF